MYQVRLWLRFAMICFKQQQQIQNFDVTRLTFSVISIYKCDVLGYKMLKLKSSIVIQCPC